MRTTLSLAALCLSETASALQTHPAINIGGGSSNLGGSSSTLIGSSSTDRARIGTLDAPSIGVGTIAWSDDSYAATADACLREGLNFFDTAERYGASGASLIPAALASVGVPVDKSYLGGDTESRLQQWVGERGSVGTKFAPTPWRSDAQSVVEACLGSCERLGVESLPLFQVHMPDIIQPFKALGIEDRTDEALWDGLAECYHSGIAQNVGVSNYGPTLLRRCHAALAARGVPLASNQIHFNLLYRRQGSQATLDTCKELDVACLAYYPLAMGLLTGKLTPARLRGKTDVRSRELLRYLEGGAPRAGEFPATAGVIPSGGIRPLLIALQDVAARVGKTPAQVSLNYIICKGAIPLAGASSPIQVQDNAGALGWRLSADDVARLEAAADSLPFEFRGSGFQTADSKFVGYGFERWRLD